MRKAQENLKEEIKWKDVKIIELNKKKWSVTWKRQLNRSKEV